MKTKPIPKESPSEHWEQVVYFLKLREWFHRWPELGLVHAVPNGGFRPKKVAKEMKEEGAKAGVPDIFLPIPRGQFHGAYIEMKRLPWRDKNNKLRRPRPSPEQKKYIAALKAQGYYVVVCEGHHQALERTKCYMMQGEFKSECVSSVKQTPENRDVGA